MALKYLRTADLLEVRKEKEKEEMNKANVLLELAEKETRIKKLEEENANILMELATLKGGM